MHNVKAMKAFVAVAELGSFAAGAASLSVSTSSLSRLVGDLEAWLGTSLLRRSTRHVTLTDAGMVYLERCRAIVGAWDDLEADARLDMKHPKGRLTVAGAAYSVRQLLAPHIAAFMQAHPDIRINLDLQNDPVDLVAESTDVAFRLGEPKDSALIAKKCGEVPLVMTASPDFIEKHGMPNSLADLPNIPCLLDSTSKAGNHWPVGHGRNVEFVFEANDGEIIRQMTLAGAGISMIPGFFVDEDIKSGRLLRLFENELDARLSVYFIMPERRHILPTARVFVDFASEQIRKKFPTKLE